jgi:hypothetical protein
MKTVLFYAILLSLLQSCELFGDRNIPLVFQNDANHSIKVYQNDNERYENIYPDTTISSVAPLGQKLERNHYRERSNLEKYI